MSDKKAFVFDTNFIVQRTNLEEVINNLKDDFTVYVTEVSIDERIAQKCRDIKEKYDNIEKLKKDYFWIANITIKGTYDSIIDRVKEYSLEGYKRTFGSNIIPYCKNQETFEAVIKRVDEKLPPFSAAKNASDKGFKDYLIWKSIVDYFKDNGEDEIIFLTDDKSGFINNIDFLTDEFEAITNKSISFKSNNFYKDLIKPQENEEEINSDVIDIPQDINSLRREINTVINSLCYAEGMNFFGGYDNYKTFTTSELVDNEYVKNVFDNMHSILLEHIFVETIPASIIFDLDGRIKDTGTEIRIQDIEIAVKLYNNIKNNYYKYIDQFYSAVTKIMNENYRVTHNVFDDDDIPF